MQPDQSIQTPTPLEIPATAVLTKKPSLFWFVGIFTFPFMFFGSLIGPFLGPITPIVVFPLLIIAVSNFGKAYFTYRDAVFYVGVILRLFGHIGLLLLISIILFLPIALQALQPGQEVIDRMTKQGGILIFATLLIFPFLSSIISYFQFKKSLQ